MKSVSGKPSKKTGAVVALFLGLSAPAYSSPFGNVAIFGDSLSDGGTYYLAVPSGGLFTTNPGPVWSQVVSAGLGISPAPARLYIGTGYLSNPTGNIWAQGGAGVTTSPPQTYDVPGTGTITVVAESVTTQIDNYLARNGGIDPNTLYVLWGGANNLAALAQSNLAPAALQSAVIVTGQDMAGQVARLQAAGARYIVVFNLPDLGRTPRAVLAGPATANALTGLSQAFNSTLDASLNANGVQALRLDSYRLLNEVLDNPGAYGFIVSNTDTACTTASSITCNPSTLKTPTAASDFMFADGIHPTTATHRILADYVLTTLIAPFVVAQVADRLAGTADGQWLNTHSRERRFLDGLQSEGQAEFYITGQAADTKRDTTDIEPEIEGKPYALRIGADRNFGDGWFGGVALSRLDDRIKVSGLGEQKGRGYSITAYGSKRFGSLYVSAGLGYTRLDYNLRRSFALGSANREEEGHTTGSAKGARLETGYDFSQGIFRHGPLVAVTFSEVSLKGYSEDSGRSTALRFGDQKFQQLRTSVGYQASWQVLESLRLAAQLTSEHNERDASRDLSFGLATNAGVMTVPVGMASGRYTQLNLGFDWRLGKASTLSAAVSAAEHEKGQTQRAGLITYSVAF